MAAILGPMSMLSWPGFGVCVRPKGRKRAASWSRILAGFIAHSGIPLL